MQVTNTKPSPLVLAELIWSCRITPFCLAASDTDRKAWKPHPYLPTSALQSARE